MKSTIIIFIQKSNERLAEFLETVSPDQQAQNAFTSLNADGFGSKICIIRTEILIMSKLKMSPEELKAESLRLHDLRQERSKVASQAVKEMSKHPLSSEQFREQIRQHHEDAERLEKRN